MVDVDWCWTDTNPLDPYDKKRTLIILNLDQTTFTIYLAGVALPGDKSDNNR